ncbi:hypothetical protein [Flavobacterium sp.]|nr:hypothetical protein [Flavobacterium sp.]
MIVSITTLISCGPHRLSCGPGRRCEVQQKANHNQLVPSQEKVNT